MRLELYLKLGVMTQTRYNHRSLFLLDSIQQLKRAVSGERLAFQAGTEEFEPPSPLQWKYRKNKFVIC